MTNGNRAWETVQECDVDRALVETLHADAAFVAWLSARMGILTSDKVEGAGIGECVAYQSVETTGEGYGETDVHVILHLEANGSDRRVILLIEDKVMSGFTLDQPQRYRERAQRLMRVGECNLALTVLFAPSAYLKKIPAPGFDVCLSHESVLEFIRARMSEALPEATRSSLTNAASIIDMAIKKQQYATGSHSTLIIPDAAMRGFFDEYYAFIASSFPDLRPHPKRNRSKGSREMVFDIPGQKELLCPHGLWVNHEINKGEIYIEFRGWRPNDHHYVPRLKRIMPKETSIRIKPTSKMAIHLMVPMQPVVDREKPVATQVSELTACLEAVRMLSRWHVEHLPEMIEWAKTAPALGTEQ